MPVHCKCRFNLFGDCLALGTTYYCVWLSAWGTCLNPREEHKVEYGE